MTSVLAYYYTLIVFLKTCQNCCVYLAPIPFLLLKSKELILVFIHVFYLALPQSGDYFGHIKKLHWYKLWNTLTLGIDSE
jgi:hypothetical protein